MDASEARRSRGRIAGRPRAGFILIAALAAGSTALAPVRTVTAQARLTGLPADRGPPSDTFPHARHTSLQCLTCHLSRSGDVLTFQPPDGCRACHHRNPTSIDCARCHAPAGLPDTMGRDLAIAAAGEPAHHRLVAFPHARHAELGCAACHAQPLTLLPVDSAATCQGCHDRHHEAGRACATCHRTDSILSIHAPPVRVHVACDACHATAAIAALTPSRSFCLACHGPAADHNPGRECVSCHFQATPDGYRARLLRSGRPG
ncbi:MAG: hypothetical protein AB7I33_11470 [Gemmatimonadales bacterium]